jgi:hypothetical protein
MRHVIAAIAACVMLCETVAAAPLVPTDSGWLQTGVHSQCNVMIDKINAGAYCNHRVSVMCVQGGQSYVTGVAQPNQAYQSPLTLQLYRWPMTTPVGSVTLIHGAGGLTLSLNGESGTWLQAGSYVGEDSCAAVTPLPQPSGPHYPRMCREFGLYCGG